MTSITYTKADGTPIETLSYIYDPAGQRISKSLGSQSLQETGVAASYDAANRLTSVAISGETFTLDYDNNGNLVSKSGPVSGTTTYTWDARNRLAAINSPTLTASFRYDAQDRRIERTVNGNTIGYLYDETQAIAELRSNAIDIAYHTGFQIDEVLARYGSAGNKTLLTDALMSVIAQANDDVLEELDQMGKSDVGLEDEEKRLEGRVKEVLEEVRHCSVVETLVRLGPGGMAKLLGRLEGNGVELVQMAESIMNEAEE